MSLPVNYRRTARAELEEAVDWFEARRAGSGGRFEAAVARVVVDLAANPHQFAEVHGDVREAPVPRYRYAVYYRAWPDRVEIISVCHTSRDPAAWQSRA